MLHHPRRGQRRGTAFDTNGEPEADGADRRNETKVIGRTDAHEIDRHTGRGGGHEPVQLPYRAADGDGVRDIFPGYHLRQQGHTAWPVEGADTSRYEGEHHDMPKRDPSG